ncbi:MAG: hypothetical protein EAZ41_02095 [Sphingobacteriia bacterium]|nr:MAG: hypothetical protein EAZ41_02095 [Sphingobacteriia bacterium]
MIFVKVYQMAGMANVDTANHHMKHHKRQIQMNFLEIMAFGIVIFLIIWLLQNLPNLFRSLKNLF